MKINISKIVNKMHANFYMFVYGIVGAKKKKIDNFMGTLGLEGSEGSKLKYEELWEYKALIPNLEKKK